MRALFLFAVIGFVLSASPAEAAASLLGQNCPTLGITKMDDNKANIIACLQASETDATLTWKAISSGSQQGDIQCFSALDEFCVNPINGKVCTNTGGGWMCNTPTGYNPGPGFINCSRDAMTGALDCVNISTGTRCNKYSGNWMCSTKAGFNIR